MSSNFIPNSLLIIDTSVSGEVSQSSVVGLLLFITFINDLDVGTESFLIKFTDDAKLGDVANSSAFRRVLIR